MPWVSGGLVVGQLLNGDQSVDAGASVIGGADSHFDGEFRDDSQVVHLGVEGCFEAIAEVACVVQWCADADVHPLGSGRHRAPVDSVGAVYVRCGDLAESAAGKDCFGVAYPPVFRLVQSNGAVLAWEQGCQQQDQSEQGHDDRCGDDGGAAPGQISGGFAS